MAISPTSSGTSNFNFDGVVSGLNTTDIIDKLMSLESAPLTHLAQQKQSIQRRDKAYQDLRTRVSAFQSSSLREWLNEMVGEVQNGVYKLDST